MIYAVGTQIELHLSFIQIYKTVRKCLETGLGFYQNSSYLAVEEKNLRKNHLTKAIHLLLVTLSHNNSVWRLLIAQMSQTKTKFLSDLTKIS